MSDVLAGYIETWRSEAAQNVALLRELDESDWAKETDLPGWNVRFVAAHCAHLESDLAGNPQEHVDVPPAQHIKGLMGQYTEMGPLAREHLTTEQIIDELETSVAKRYDALQAMMPLDPKALGDGFAGLIGWSWETFLSNRPVDLWMHEQDIRRATGRHGGLECPGATHVAAVFANSLPYVVGKKAKAPAGTTVVVNVTGPNAYVIAAGVGDDRRGFAIAEPPTDPTVTLTLEFESWIILSGGRRTPDQVDVKVDGDEELGQQILENLGVTP
jgi:uncharacterized protein (TIGR03083 family)